MLLFRTIEGPPLAGIIRTAAKVAAVRSTGRR